MLTVLVMRIEILTVPDCPNRATAHDNIREALAGLGRADATIIERVIGDPALAVEAGMAGSPTILVNGVDPFASATAEPSVSCRLYRTDGAMGGAPSVVQLREALTL